MMSEGTNNGKGQDAMKYYQIKQSLGSYGSINVDWRGDETDKAHVFKDERKASNFCKRRGGYYETVHESTVLAMPNYFVISKF